MYYITYLIGIGFFFIKGIGVTNLSGFMDSTTLIFVLFPCFLMLFCTKSFKAFGECFLFELRKKNYSLPQCKGCLQSIKMFMSTAVISGMICFLIAGINILQLFDISQESLPLLGANISVALLSIFYVLFIFILLLPLYVMLKQHILKLLSADDGNGTASEEGY